MINPDCDPPTLFPTAVPHIHSHISSNINNINIHSVHSHSDSDPDNGADSHSDRIIPFFHKQ